MNTHRIVIARTLFASLITLAFFHCRAGAQDGFDLGGQAGAAMRMGFGARGIGMANALTAVKEDFGVGYYNPALVPFETHPNALLSAGFLPFDRNLNFASFSQSIKPTGGFSLAIINSGVSKIQGRNVDGTTTDVYSTSENEFLFTFGVKLRPNFAIGVSPKIFYYSLFEGVKSTTVGFDIGMLYVFSDSWTLGVVVADINSKYKWDTSQLYGAAGNTTIDRFPLRRKVALCYTPVIVKGLLAAEVEWIGSVMLARAGAEMAIHENISLRGGVDQIDFGRNINAKPSIGLSFRTNVGTIHPVVDYAYVIEPYSTGGIHMLSVRMSFE